MATSDNVVRAGLTPKLKDAETLAEMLTYRLAPADVLTGEQKSGIDEAQGVVERHYRVSVDDFALARVELSAPATKHNLAANANGSATIALVTQGSGSINGIKCSAGSAFLVPAQKAIDIVREADCAKIQVFVASTNLKET